MQPLPCGGNGYFRCNIPFLSLSLSPSPYFSDSACIFKMLSSRSHTFLLCFTVSRGEQPCATSCQNIHIADADLFCVPVLGGKGQSTSLISQIAGIGLYGTAIKKESGKKCRRDGKPKKICHNDIGQHGRSRHRGCSYANHNIKCMGNLPVRTRTRSRLSAPVCHIFYEIWSSSDDTNDQLLAFE